MHTQLQPLLANMRKDQRIPGCVGACGRGDLPMQIANLTFARFLAALLVYLAHFQDYRTLSDCCGVYVAMTLADAGRVWSVVNIDTLDDRALFTRTPEPRNYSAEDREGRIARRKARWCPTTLVGWPALGSG